MGENSFAIKGEFSVAIDNYTNDHEGNGLVVTDEAGNKVIERDFTPFGERIDQAGHEGKFPDETEDGFTGKDWDEDIGLYYFNARWYDPEVGRFVSEDSVADDPSLYGYCFNNPINMIDPTGNIAIGLQQGWGMVGAMIGAAETLSGDSTLGAISSAFNLFVSIKTAIKVAQIKQAIAELAQTNQPEQDPVDAASDQSGDGTGESTKPASTPTENTGTTDTTNDNTTVGTEIVTLTTTDILVDRIQNGQIDLNTNIDDLMKEWGVDPKEALVIIKAAVNYIVSKLPRDEKTGYVEMPFNTVAPENGSPYWAKNLQHFSLLGLQYGNYPVAGDGFTWAKPESLIKAMTSALYFNYLNPNFHIDFNDLSLRTGADNADHDTHMKGTSFDVKITWNDNGTYRQVTNIQQSPKNKNNLYIRGNTVYQKNKAIVQSYVDILNSLGARQVLWCDWSLTGVDQRVKNDDKISLRVEHRNHIHIEI